MKIYLVGGAIRDQLLGIPVKDKDWVVVGSTPEEMRAKQFKQVGKDFPVFIHPKTGEEYALARTERKSGHGYTGFEFDTNPNVTLEEDLARRDLTINAIAQDKDGKMLIGTSKGLSIYDGENFDNFNFTHGIGNGFVTDIEVVGNNILKENVFFVVSRLKII